MQGRRNLIVNIKYVSKIKLVDHLPYVIRVIFTLAPKNIYLEGIGFVVVIFAFVDFFR